MKSNDSDVVSLVISGGVTDINRVPAHFLDWGTNSPFATNSSHNLPKAHFSLASCRSKSGFSPTSQSSSLRERFEATLASAIHLSTSLITLVISGWYCVRKEASLVTAFNRDLYRFKRGVIDMENERRCSPVWMVEIILCQGSRGGTIVGQCLSTRECHSGRRRAPAGQYLRPGPAWQVQKRDGEKRKGEKRLIL